MGWDNRSKNPKELTIVLHTTNGQKNSSFENEVKYLLNSPNVSAHYIVSKDTRVVEMLPIELRAWHAGVVSEPRYNNNNTIGIEMHYTPGESIEPEQKDNTRSLVRHIMQNGKYKISDIVMHRSVARPKGRKIDPSNFTDLEFAAWKEITLCTHMKKLIKGGTVIWTSPDYDHPKAVHIDTDRIDKGIVIHDYIETVARVDTEWYWITNGIGFVERRFVE